MKQINSEIVMNTWFQYCIQEYVVIVKGKQIRLPYGRAGRSTKDLNGKKGWNKISRDCYKFFTSNNSILTVGPYSRKLL